jgi:hypothetical protein
MTPPPPPPPLLLLLLYVQAGREFMGRAAVPLTQFISEEGLEDEFQLPLGKGDWTNLEGPVSGVRESPGMGECLLPGA